MLIRSSKKVKFYVSFFLVFALLTTVISLAVSWLLIQVKHPGMTLESMFFTEDWILLIGLVNATTISVLPFLTNHYRFTEKDTEGQFSLSNLFKITGAKEWFYYLISIAGITLLYGFFYFKDVQLVDDPNNLDFLLSQMDTNDNYFLSSWKKGLVLYLTMFFPIILISIIVISQKVGKISIPSIMIHWKHMVAFILINLILTSLYFTLFQLVDSLVLNLIRIPFEENYIPTFFALAVLVALNSMYYMILSKMAFYCFFSMEELDVPYRKEESEDLLDQ